LGEKNINARHWAVNEFVEKKKIQQEINKRTNGPTEKSSERIKVPKKTKKKKGEDGNRVK